MSFVKKLIGGGGGGDNQEASGDAAVDGPGGNFEFACLTSELNPSKKVKIKNVTLAIFKYVDKTNKSNRYYAIANTCAHQGFPLYRGDIEDIGGTPCLRCPAHGVRFNLKSGCSETGEYKQATYKVVVKGGKVWVDVSKKTNK